MNRHHVISAAAGALCLAAVLSAAQAVPEFELVSVRRSPPVSAAPAAGTPGPRAGFFVLPDGRFEARGQTLENLARVAFGSEDAPARGRNAYWLSNDRFDITASAGHPWPPSPGATVPAELRTMLRALLEDRFALKARIEMKKLDVAALQLAKPERLGPGLRPSAAECRGPFTDASTGEAPPRPRCPFNSTGYRDFQIHAEAVTMPEVAQLVAQLPYMEVYQPLVDGTRLPGLYDVSFSRRGYMTQERVLVELEAQLGLRVQRTRMPLPTLIIERAKKPQED